MADLLYDALLRPYSQLMLIAIVIELVLLSLVLRKCLRKDLRAVFSALMLVAIFAQLFAIISDSFKTVEYYSYAATFLVFLIPALLLALVFVYLHGRLNLATKASLVIVLLFSVIIVMALILPPPAFLTSAQYQLGKAFFIFVYVCVAFGGAASEVYIDKPPESMLVLLTVVPSLALWLLSMNGFNAQGALAFSQKSDDSLATASVMSPLFLSSFLYIPFAAAVFKTNAVGAKLQKPDGPPKIPGGFTPSLYTVRERRPKYSYAFLRGLADRNMPCLLLTKSPPKTVKERYGLGGIGIVHITAQGGKADTIHPRELNRIYATIGLFAETHPGGVIMLDGLDYLFTNSSHLDVLGFALSANRKVRENRGVLIIPQCLLTVEERNWLRGFLGKFIEAPELGEDIPTLAKSALGEAGIVMLDGILEEAGLRPETLEFSHVPIIARRLRDAVSGLGVAEGTDKKKREWERSARKLSESISALAHMPWEVREARNE